MKIAVPVWEGRISPVFDTARRLLLVERDGTQEVSRTEMLLHEQLPVRRAARLGALGVEVLICGAISRPLASIIVGQGIRVVPFISGAADEVLSAFLSGRLWDAALVMPGCRRWRHMWGRGGRRRKGPGRRGGVS